MRRARALGGLVVLAIGGQAHVTAPSRQPVEGTYKVRRGDTLAKVAKRTGLAVDVLASANGIANPHKLREGTVLKLAKLGEPAPATPAPLPPLPSPVVVVGNEATHTVAVGQTLSEIARRYGTAVPELVKLNGLKNPNLIREGTTLNVPGAGWICPVQGRRQFGDGWGQPRGGGRRHTGVDIFAAKGTPVVASVSGTVVHSPGARAGLAYYLNGDDGITYYGAHLDTVAAPGRVERGGVVGTVGTTGNAEGTTPHLHFEIKPGGGAPVNPYPSLVRWC